MYFKKVPKFMEDLIEMIRISQRVIEKIFIREIEGFNLYVKSPEAKKIFDNENDIKFHKEYESSRIIKLFLTIGPQLHIFSEIKEKDEKVEFKKFLSMVLIYRNEIAHNKIKNLNAEKLIKFVDLIQKNLKFCENVHSGVVKNKYCIFLENFRRRLLETIESKLIILSCNLEKLNTSNSKSKNNSNKISVYLEKKEISNK
jgi:hypothetical protein